MAAGLCAATWGLAPWVDDLGLLTFIGATAWAFTMRCHAPLALLAGILATGLQLAWLPGVWRDGGHAAAGLALLAAVVLQVLPHALAVLVVLRTRERAGPELAVLLGWMVAAGIAPAVQPLPALHALWLADTSAWLWPAAWLGRVGLTGLTAAWGAVVWRRPVIAALGLGVWFGLGNVPSGTPERLLRFGIFQPDLHVMDARVPRHRAHRAATIQAVAEDVSVDLLVLPEGAWPFDPGEPGSTRRASLRTALAGTGRILLGATVGDEPATNSALLVVGGEVRARIDKRVLVPIWERSVFGWGRDRFRAGTGTSTFDLGPHRLGVLICYEDLFEHRLRDVGTAHVLLLPSNDSWLGPVGKRMHLAAARLAGASLRRPVVRATLDGTSGIVGAGELLLDTPTTYWPDAPGRTIEVTIAPTDRWAPGVYLSRWLALAAWVVVLLVGRR